MDNVSFSSFYEAFLVPLHNCSLALLACDQIKIGLVMTRRSAKNFKEKAQENLHMSVTKDTATASRNDSRDDSALDDSQ